MKQLVLTTATTILMINIAYTISNYAMYIANDAIYTPLSTYVITYIFFTFGVLTLCRTKIVIGVLPLFAFYHCYLKSPHSASNSFMQPHFNSLCYQLFHIMRYYVVLNNLCAHVLRSATAWICCVVDVQLASYI